MIGLFFGGLIKSALGFLKGLPWQVWAGLGVLLALLFAWHLHTGWEKANWNAGYNAAFNVQQKRVDRARADNAIQRASIDKLTAALDDQSAAVAKLASESDTRTKASEQARIAAQQAARASNDTARALDASAAQARSKGGPCVPGETFLNHSGEL